MVVGRVVLQLLLPRRPAGGGTMNVGAPVYRVTYLACARSSPSVVPRVRLRLGGSCCVSVARA